MQISQVIQLQKIPACYWDDDLEGIMFNPASEEVWVAFDDGGREEFTCAICGRVVRVGWYNPDRHEAVCSSHVETTAAS